jgi:hypothetical protein
MRTLIKIELSSVDTWVDILCHSYCWLKAEVEGCEKSVILLKAHEIDLKMTSSPSEKKYTLVTLTTGCGGKGPS